MQAQARIRKADTVREFALFQARHLVHPENRLGFVVGLKMRYGENGYQKVEAFARRLQVIDEGMKAENEQGLREAMKELGVKPERMLPLVDKAEKKDAAGIAPLFRGIPDKESALMLGALHYPFAAFAMQFLRDDLVSIVLDQLNDYKSFIILELFTPQRRKKVMGLLSATKRDELANLSSPLSIRLRLGGEQTVETARELSRLSVSKCAYFLAKEVPLDYKVDIISEISKICKETAASVAETIGAYDRAINLRGGFPILFERW